MIDFIHVYVNGKSSASILFCLPQSTEKVLIFSQTFYLLTLDKIKIYLLVLKQIC